MKKELRKTIQAKRLQLTDQDVITKSRSIFEHLLTLPEFNQASAVMLYMDFRKEVQTEPIIEHCLKHGKKVILPVVSEDKKNLVLIEITSLKNDLTLSSFGILEPVVRPESIRKIEDIDLILSPGVAFDRTGYRLGYGGGYYDRLLSGKHDRIKVWALAFDLQIVEAVPREDYDQQIDGIVTESGIHRIGNQES